MAYIFSTTKKNSDQKESSGSTNTTTSDEVSISKEKELELIEQLKKELNDPNYPKRDSEWGKARIKELFKETIQEQIIIAQVNKEYNDPTYPERDSVWAKKRLAELLLEPAKATLAQQEQEISALSKIIESTNSTIQQLTKKTELYSSELKLPNVSPPVVKETIINPTTETKTTELSFSRKISHDTYQGYNVKASLTFDGKLSVIDKTSKQDLSNNFTVLYLDKDNKIKDQNGKVVTLLENDFGKVSADYYANKIDKNLLNSKGLSGLQAGQLNSFRHNGKQVIFAKANETKTEAKTEEKQSNQEISKQAPWSKVTYHELENGRWMTKDAYVRKSLDSNKKEILEVFVGKDSTGKDIWKDARTVSNPKLNLVSYSKSKGEFFNQNGEKISSFDTHNNKLDANTVKNLLDNSPDKLFTLKSDKFNSLQVQGRRPVFIEIP